MSEETIHRIDVHHHILPQHYVGSLAKVGITGSGGVPFPGWSEQGALDAMDQLGIEMAITSISAPGVFFGEGQDARDLARRCNETSAKLIQDYPRRFGAFAILPLPDIDGAMIELDYALDELKLDGVILLASQADGTYLGDPEYTGLMDELSRRKVTVFVHPTSHPSTKYIPVKLPHFAAEFVFDTSRAILNLIAMGVAERCPDIKFIFSHAGGTAPFLAWRWNLLSMLDDSPLKVTAPKGVIHYMKQFYYDTALSGNPYALKSLSELVPPSHILFGSDYVFVPVELIVSGIEGVKAHEAFAGEALKAVERGNALKLLPSVSGRMAK